MGRITVFTRSDDLNSKRLVKELERRSLPYEEIDVSLYPSRCQDLHAILDAPSSVPHVFFNTRYVGGLDKCIEELAQWDKSSRYATPLNKYKVEIASAFDPASRHLALPNREKDARETEEPAKGRRAPVDIKLPNGKVLGIRQMMEHLKDWVPVDTIEYKQSLHYKSFLGRTMSVSLEKALQIPEDETIRLCKMLLKDGLVRPVDSSRGSNSFDYKHVYQLQCDAQHHVLNSYLVWPTRLKAPPTNPMEMVDNLLRLLNVMEMSSIDPDDGLLNSKHAVRLHKFAMFEEAMCELQQLSKSSLFLLSEDAMTAFALNLYSLMVRYAYLKVGIPRSEVDRLHWLNKKKFLLAGDEYTLQEWLDTLLGKSAYMGGNNSISSSTFAGNNSATNFFINNSNTNHNEESSSSEHLALKHDKRILLALFVGPYGGSRWSTAFSRFSEQNLDEQLEIAAQVFCLDDRYVHVNRKEHKLELLRSVFQAHRSDFSAKESGLAKAILPFLTGKKRLDVTAMLSTNKAIKVAYMEGPELGTHTIEGPWYCSTRKSKDSSSKIGNIAVRGGGVVASVFKTMVKTKDCGTGMSSSSNHSSRAQ